MRKTLDELKELCEQCNVDRIWSFSRYNKYITSHYEYFLRYIKNIPYDNVNSIYGYLGGMVHDILEKLYNGDIQNDENIHENLFKQFDNAWTISQISGLLFDRSNPNKNKTIAEKYYQDIKYFFLNYNILPYKMINEQFVLIKIGDEYFHGYIDNIYKDENNIYNILDYKTSTIYKGEKALHESKQLLLYAIGLHQLGVPYNKIKIKWNFLKYVTVDCTQANGKINTRYIERCNLSNSLATNVKMWLKKNKYSEDDINKILENFRISNDINILPDEIKEKYVIHDCYVELNITEEEADNLIEEITDTIKIIREKERNYEITKDEREFWDSEDSLRNNEYYYINICSYKINTMLPYKLYLKKKEEDKNNISLFYTSHDNIVPKEKVNSDMDWLNNI